MSGLRQVDHSLRGVLACNKSFLFLVLRLNKYYLDMRTLDTLHMPRIRKSYRAYTILVIFHYCLLKMLSIYLNFSSSLIDRLL